MSKHMLIWYLSCNVPAVCKNDEKHFKLEIKHMQN